MTPGYGERWWEYETSYTAPTVATPANLYIPWAKTTTNSTTSVTITFGSSTVTPGSYGGAIVSSGTYNDPDFVINTNTATHTRTGLNPGQKYSFRVRAYSGAGATGTYGEYVYGSFTMPLPSTVTAISDSTSKTTTPVDHEMTKRALDKLYRDEELIDPDGTNLNLSNSTFSTNQGSSFSANQGSSVASSGNRTVQRSYLKVSNTNKERKNYSIAIKHTNISTSYKKYSFGAGIVFGSALTTPKSAGGLGFFTDPLGTSGYFIELQTDASNENNEDKSLKIFKVVGGKKIPLQDSQEPNTPGKLKGGVLAARLYKLDVDVTVENTVVVINVYIDNFKVTAVDTTKSGSPTPIQTIISPTANVALFSVLDSVFFDYVYANPVSDTQIVDTSSRGLYNGLYSGTTLDFIFGEKIIQDFNSPSNKVAYLEEFGTVARELRYVKANFNQPAAIPLYASTGTNKFASIVGSKFSNHGTELFVINNASTFIPLQAGNEKFFVVGNYVDVSARHEYTETTTSEYTTLEPATFDSTWIQSEADAKSLFNWIKGQWSKQQQSINMEIFGNPVIEVGDIITVNYAKNGLDGTQKFLVTNVNSNFDGGLSTSITARSIYSQ